MFFNLLVVRRVNARSALGDTRARGALVGMRVQHLIMHNNRDNMKTDECFVHTVNDEHHHYHHHSTISNIRHPHNLRFHFCLCAHAAGITLNFEVSDKRKLRQ